MKASKVLFLVLSIMISLCIVNTQPVRAEATIQSDGSVDPSTAPVHRAGNVYTLTGDVTGGIMVHASNIIIDGNGHMMQEGTLTLSGSPEKTRNVIIKNIIFQNSGILLNDCNYVTLTGNTITGSSSHPEGSITVYGGISNIMVGNTIADNQIGVVISGASDTLIYHNNFINNTVDVSPFKVLWTLGNDAALFDNGKEGNYWSRYTGADANGDGLGDTPYTIDENNQDLYPLMAPITPQVIILPPPAISVVLPENKTYTVNNIPLTFTVSKSTSWMGYSLDGQTNVTIYGNTTLTGLSDKTHSMIAYAGDVVYGVGASNTVYFTIDTNPPNITVLSPESKTYNTTDIPLTFTVNETTPWIGYSLDNQTNMTITGNTTLTGLFDGTHSLRVYAKDTAGNMGDSETVHFTIAHETQPSEPFPTTLVAVSVVTIVAAVVCTSFLVYFRKRNHARINKHSEIEQSSK